MMKAYAIIHIQSDGYSVKAIFVFVSKMGHKFTHNSRVSEVVGHH